MLTFASTFISVPGRKSRIRVPKHLRTVTEKLPKKRKSKRSTSVLWVHLRGWILVESNYKCFMCGNFANQVHHIKPVCEYPELQLDKSNLVVLCGGCHRKKHKNLPEKLFMNNSQKI
jgi:5-methylcytosine-specific restriction endonuclease McrA